MKLILFIMMVISILGFIHSIAHGIIEDKASAMYYMMPDMKYFKRASFFAFMIIVLLTLFLNVR